MASGSPNLCQVYYPNGPQYASIVASFGGAFFVVNSACLWRKWAGLLQHWATDDVLAENELVHWWWVAAQVNRLLLASEMIEMKMGSTPRHGNFYWEDPEKEDVFPGITIHFIVIISWENPFPSCSQVQPFAIILPLSNHIYQHDTIYHHYTNQSFCIDHLTPCLCLYQRFWCHAHFSLLDQVKRTSSSVFWKAELLLWKKNSAGWGRSFSNHLRIGGSRRHK